MAVYYNALFYIFDNFTIISLISVTKSRPMVIKSLRTYMSTERYTASLTWYCLLLVSHMSIADLLFQNYRARVILLVCPIRLELILLLFQECLNPRKCRRVHYRLT
jgi:hypothetical protein